MGGQRTFYPLLIVHLIKGDNVLVHKIHQIAASPPPGMLLPAGRRNAVLDEMAGWPRIVNCQQNVPQNYTTFVQKLNEQIE